VVAVTATGGTVVMSGATKATPAAQQPTANVASRRPSAANPPPSRHLLSSRSAHLPHGNGMHPLRRTRESRSHQMPAWLNTQCQLRPIRDRAADAAEATLAVDEFELCRGIPTSVPRPGFSRP